MSSSRFDRFSERNKTLKISIIDLLEHIQSLLDESFILLEIVLSTYSI